LAHHGRQAAKDERHPVTDIGPFTSFAFHDSCYVEIQLRTGLQDLWAQVFERFSDIAGRGIRYGDVPDNPTVQRAVEELLVKF
jgi:ppGpp synthetase/RelA/SpoT-type nucleotidyltranferase